MEKPLDEYKKRKDVKDKRKGHCISCRIKPKHLYINKLPKKNKNCLICNKSYLPKSAREKYCKDCLPSKKWESKFHNYGVSKPIWDAILDSQNYSCAICESKNAHDLDHCHKTGRARGILCRKCNMAISYFEDFEYAQKCLKYLKDRK